MPNQSGRKCCYCGQKGHNSRTCSSKGCAGFKLFGVQIDVPPSDGGGGGGASSTIRKSKSLGNLEAFNRDDEKVIATAADDSGYLSDGLIHQSSKSHDRKKGKPWTEEEHRSFLMGLEKLGKGDWKGIASKYVPSRKSSQVASHAQKYFIRKAGIEKKRRRTSVFDIPLTDMNNSSSSQVITGSQGDKPAVEISSQTVAAAAASSSSNNMSELKGQANKQILPAHVATTAERPPLSPMKTHGIIDFRGTYYKPYWVPVVNFASQNNGVFIPTFHGTLATCTPFVPTQQSVAAALQQRSSQAAGSAAAAAPMSNNDELNLNIRKLALH